MKASLFSADLLVALTSVAVGGAILALVPYEIAGQTLAAVSDMNSPAFFPIIAAALLIICGLVLGVGALAAIRVGGHEDVEFKRRGSVLTVMAIFVLFAIGTNFLGMIPSAVLTILAMAWFLEYRNAWVLIPVAVGVPAVIYVLFERVLLILLPRGVLFS